MPLRITRSARLVSRPGAVDKTAPGIAPSRRDLLAPRASMAAMRGVDWIMAKVKSVRDIPASRCARWANLALSAGFVAALLRDIGYYGRSGHLHPLEQAVGGTALLCIFGSITLVNLASDVICRDDDCLQTWGVYLVRQSGYLVAFCNWAFVLMVNNAAMRAAGSPSLWPLSFLCGGLAVLCAVSFIDTCDIFLSNTRPGKQGAKAGVRIAA